MSFDRPRQAAISFDATSGRNGGARFFGIAEMAGSYSVSLRTLRFYEERGLLEPERIGAARRYGPRDRIRLELILKGKRLGLGLHEIGRLITRSEVLARDVTACLDKTRLQTQIDALERRRADIQKAIDDLTAALERPA